MEKTRSGRVSITRQSGAINQPALSDWLQIGDSKPIWEVFGGLTTILTDSGVLADGACIISCHCYFCSDVQKRSDILMWADLPVLATSNSLMPDQLTN